MKLRLVLAGILCASGIAGLQAPAAAQDTGDTRGPVVSANMQVTVSKDGVQAPGYLFHPGKPWPSAWQANWITAADKPDGVVLLRKEVTLDETPRQVQARLTATGNYRLYINGRLADRGPADSGRDFNGATDGMFYNVRDFAPLFHKGKNVLAVEVHGRGVFIFEAVARMPGGHKIIVNSDATWHGVPAKHLAEDGWKFDGAQEPIGWQTADFDASSWPVCSLMGAPHSPLTASELPPCMEARYPVMSVVRTTGGVRAPKMPFQNGHSVLVTADGSFAVRFDRILAAYYGIKVRGGAGARIELQPHETNAPGASNQSASLTLRDGIQTFESPGFASVGTINVLISHVTTPVEIMDVSAVFTSQPVAYQGTFSCSDERLNRIWRSSRWATQICLQTWHLDSPQHQEPISDYGDYLIEDRVGDDAFGGAIPLARQDLRKWAWIMKKLDYHTFHTSYTLLWLQALMQYYDYTGDKALVMELSPEVYGLLDRFKGYTGKNGLISEAPNYMFMDWVNIGPFTLHHPPAVIGQGYMTAFYYRALADARRVAILAGDQNRSRQYARLRQDLATAYNRELWSPAKGLYRDGKPFQSSVRPNDWLPADQNIETFSAQNNVLAVLYDLAPKGRQKAIIDQVMAQTPWNLRPYYMHFVLDAIAHAGSFDRYGTEWMRKWRIVPETQTFYEMGDQGDLSHGWIATPVCQMSEQVLGIQPDGPAFRAVGIHPTLCDLTWAKGNMPTAHGPVSVSWARKGDALTLSVTIPSGTKANVAFPTGSPQSATITSNGKTLWSGGRAAASIPGIGGARVATNAIVFEVMPGSYTFAGHGLRLPAIVHEAKKPTLSHGVGGRTSPDSQAAFEAELSKASLVGLGQETCVSAVDSGTSHMGGGTDADAIRNGTTKNGAGGAETMDDGKTFRGYGTGSTLVFQLNTRRNPAGYDITRIATFAGHADSRASQNYSVSIATVSAPTRFITIVPSASVACDSGSSEIVLKGVGSGVLLGSGGIRASGVAAIRFDFRDGSVENGNGSGFNVYREIQVVGKPSIH